MSASLPNDELDRLDALRELLILDTDPEPVFDAIVRCAVAFTGSPIALVSLVDEARQWFKARIGLDARITTREVAFCAHTILSDSPLVVPNAERDERFVDNPLVTAAPFIKSYLGAPVTTPLGHRIGTLCVIDHRPRDWSTEEIALIQNLAALVSEVLKLRSEILQSAESTGEVVALTKQMVRKDQRLSQIIEGAAVGTWEWDVQTGSLQINEQFAQIIGLCTDELETDISAWIRLWHPEDQSHASAILAACSDGAAKFEFESRLRHRDGHFVWVTSKGGVISWTDTGAPAIISGLVIDITARHEGSEKLHETLEELSAYFDLSIDFLCIAGPDGRLVKASKALEELLGYSSGALHGVRFMDFVHPDDVDSTQQIVKRLDAGVTITNFINRYRCASGEYVWVEWYGRAQNGKLYCVGRDVTEKVASEKCSRRARELADAISAMQVEVIALGSISFSLRQALQSLLGIFAGQAGFVCALECDQNDGATSTMIARAKLNIATDSRSLTSDAELLLPADWHILDQHQRAIAEILAAGFFFDGFTSAQLGSDRFVGFPIYIGAELVGVLALDEACAKSQTNSPELHTFISAVGELLLSQRDADRRRSAEENSRKIARLDALTGLGNRRVLTEEFEGRIDHASAQFALILIDLDRFKPINDLHGHLVGDEVLRIVAQRLKGVVRGDCAIIRLGSDEFAVLTEAKCDLTGIDAVSRRILDTLIAPIFVNDLTLSVGASIGVSTYPADANNLQELLQYADAAMYRAKENRCEIQFFDSSLDEGIRRRAELEIELRAAISAGQIVPYFQPVVSLKTGAVVAHEVLARWPHPQRGFIPPVEFIPVAQNIGLIEKLFWDMLKKACFLHKSAGADTLLSFNVSPSQIKDPLFAQKLLSALTRFDFPTSKFEVEVTESVMIAEADAARTMLLWLKRRGVRIALDDFGTGYSSLLLLRDLPLDKLKIDRSFLCDVASKNSPDAKIIDAILGMAAALKLVVTAEGIENEAAARALRDKGCQFGQGYLFGAAQARVLTEIDGALMAGPELFANVA